MLVSLDHDDFPKSRKALFIASVLSIVISGAEISDCPIKISGFEVVVTQTSIVFWLNVSVVYFLYIFSIRLLDHFEVRRLDRAEAYISELDEKKILQGQYETRPELLSRHVDEVGEYKTRVASRQFIYFLLVEALPAFLVATVAITGIAEKYIPMRLS